MTLDDGSVEKIISTHALTEGDYAGSDGTVLL